MTSADLHGKGGGDAGTTVGSSSAATGTGVVGCGELRPARETGCRGGGTMAAGALEVASIGRRRRGGVDGEAVDGRVGDGRLESASRTSADSGAGQG